MDSDNINNCSFCSCPPTKPGRVDPSSKDSQSKRTTATEHTTSSSTEKSFLLPYSSEPKWKSTKYGFVPDAKRRIALFGNKLLPDFYESFKTRAGANAELMKQAFITGRDGQYKVTLDIENLENRYQYLLSHNPACEGRFFREDYNPTPHDDSNIRRCKKEANDIQDKLNAVVTKLEKHDNSLLTDNGKLKTGLSCLHNFNAEQHHSIKSQVGLNVLHLVEDLDRVMAK